MIERTFIGCPGIGIKTESRLKQLGFRTWMDCLERAADLPFGPVSKQRFLRFVEQSIQALAAEDMPFFIRHLPTREHWRILDRCFDQSVFFDIETTGLSVYTDHVTVIAAHKGGRSYRFLKDENIDGFLDLIKDVALLVTFNGNAFDIPFLERTFNLPHIGLPCLDLRWMLYHLGYRGGLKSIERQMGIRRPVVLDDVDGLEAVLLYHRWQSGDLKARELLARYCEADARATYLLSRRLLHEHNLAISRKEYLLELSG